MLPPQEYVIYEAAECRFKEKLASVALKKFLFLPPPLISSSVNKIHPKKQSGF